MVFTFWHLVIICGAPEEHRNKKMNQVFYLQHRVCSTTEMLTRYSLLCSFSYNVLQLISPFEICILYVQEV